MNPEGEEPSNYSKPITCSALNLFSFLFAYECRHSTLKKRKPAFFETGLSWSGWKMGLLVPILGTHEPWRGKNLQITPNRSHAPHAIRFSFLFAYECRHSTLKKRKPAFFETGLSWSGWKMGFEPTTPGTTIQCSNRLSYIHHVIYNKVHLTHSFTML